MSNPLAISLRPADLGDFIGNKTVVTTLRNEFADGKEPVCLLFYGPPGTGKTTLALIAARLAQGDYPKDQPIDLIEYNCGDKTGIDEMRALIEACAYCPLSGRRRVVILNEAQKLTDAAQQCLLIPTEQEGSPTLWIFTTTNSEKINDALRTRCKTFKLEPMAEVQTIELIRRAADALGYEYEDDFVTTAVSRGVDSPRELLNAYELYINGIDLDKCFAGTERHEPMYAEVAKAVLRGDWNHTRALLDQIKTPDVRGLRAVITAFLRRDLVKSEPGPRADALAACLLGMGVAYEDGLAYGVTTGVLYKVCRHLSGGKQ